MENIFKNSGNKRFFSFKKDTRLYNYNESFFVFYLKLEPIPLHGCGFHVKFHIPGVNI